METLNKRKDIARKIRFFEPKRLTNGLMLDPAIMAAKEPPEMTIGNAIFASRVLKTSPAKIQNCIIERMVMISMQM